jgi:hypothetical protein
VQNVSVQLNQLNEQSTTVVRTAQASVRLLAEFGGADIGLVQSMGQSLQTQDFFQYQSSLSAFITSNYILTPNLVVQMWSSYLLKQGISRKAPFIHLANELVRTAHLHASKNEMCSKIVVSFEGQLSTFKALPRQLADKEYVASLQPWQLQLWLKALEDSVKYCNTWRDKGIFSASAIDDVVETLKPHVESLKACIEDRPAHAQEPERMLDVTDLKRPVGDAEDVFMLAPVEQPYLKVAFYQQAITESLETVEQL